MRPSQGHAPRERHDIATKGLYLVRRQGGGERGSEGEEEPVEPVVLHSPLKPFRGATKVEVVLVFPWRKSEAKKRRRLGIIPMTTKPDLDNLSKMILDSMAEANWFLGGDQQGYDLTLRKWWGDEGGITIITTGENE